MVKNSHNNEEKQASTHEHKRFCVAIGQQPVRIDKFLSQQVAYVSRTKIQKAVKDGHVLSNGKQVTANYKVKGGDLINMSFGHPPTKDLYKAEKIAISIIYEDETLAVVNKPAGLVVHPGHGNYSGTLVNGLLYYFKNLACNSSGYPGLVHRIDKETSGILVIAKTDSAMMHLAHQFAKKTIQRHYLAMVWGNPSNEQGFINGAIARNPKNRLQMSITNDPNKGKTAETHYEVLNRYGFATLIKCRLTTGRTHQIRVHMKSIGHPIFNDERYGGNTIRREKHSKYHTAFIQNCLKIMPRQALHAKTLGFIHPKSKENMFFDCQLPKDFETLVTKCNNLTEQAQPLFLPEKNRSTKEIIPSQT